MNSQTTAVILSANWFWYAKSGTPARRPFSTAIAATVRATSPSCPPRIFALKIRCRIMLESNVSMLISPHHPAHKRHRPIRHRHQRTRNKADGLQRLLFDVELPVKPVEADVESSGSFEEESRSGVKPEPDGCEERRVEPY